MAIVQKSSTGAGTVIAGLATGFHILFAAAIWTYALAGWSSISRMMADRNAISDRCFGPISDNAGGIAEMSELPKEVYILIS
jgi:K(+)-stimulated pyrophosphate-energized sodium pump